MCAGLQAVGIRLWLDIEELRRSRARWREEVHGGITGSSTLLVTLSDGWAASPACRYELAVALERRKPIVAVEVQPASDGALALLPDDVERIDGSGEMATVIDRVAGRLAALRASAARA